MIEGKSVIARGRGWLQVTGRTLRGDANVTSLSYTLPWGRRQNYIIPHQHGRLYIHIHKYIKHKVRLEQ